MAGQLHDVDSVRSRHVTERLFRAWMGAVVVSVVWFAASTTWGPGAARFLGVPPAWGISWVLFLIVVPLWLEPLQVANRPERLKREGMWRAPPRRYDRRTLRVLPALVPVTLVVALAILELGYGIFAPVGRRAAPEGMRFGIAAAALVSVPGAFLVSQVARARFQTRGRRVGGLFWVWIFVAGRGRRGRVRSAAARRSRDAARRRGSRFAKPKRDPRLLDRGAGCARNSGVARTTGGTPVPLGSFEMGWFS